MDGWTMLPIADAGATTHIIATRNDDEALFTDVDVVLYEKTATGWSGSAYDPSVTKEDAMIDLADEFGLSDPMAGDWMIDLDEIDVLDHIMPRVPFGKGFFVTDPLYNIANHIENPEPLAEGAEDAGLPAGSGAINTGGVSSSGSGGTNVGGGQSADGCGCDDACIQTMISEGADVYLAANPTTQEEADIALDHADLAMADYMEVNAFCCRIREVVNSFDPGAWGCGPFALVSGPSPSTNTNLFNCSYSRTISRTQTRTVIRTCRDCITRCTWRQTRTQSGSQPARSSVTAFSPAVPVCPPGPIVTPACVAPSEFDETDWVPGPACCP